MQVVLHRSPRNEVKTHQRKTVLFSPTLRKRRGTRTPTVLLEFLHAGTDRRKRSARSPMEKVLQSPARILLPSEET